MSESNAVELTITLDEHGNVTISSLDNLDIQQKVEILQAAYKIEYTRLMYFLDMDSKGKFPS